MMNNKENIKIQNKINLGLFYKLKSSLANKDMFARISKKNMPSPKGKVYKG